MPNLFYYASKAKTVISKLVIKISAGAYNTAVIDNKNSTWLWGSNNSGQLGDGTTIFRTTPVSVAGAVKTFCHISVGKLENVERNNHTIAIDKAGRAWAWGDNFYGQLGDNTTTSRCTPVSVAGAVKTFCHISAGDSHTVALDKSGRAWAWGANFYGQLGDNTTTSRRTPVSLLGAVKTFCHISAGGSHTVALDKSGRAWAWGSNDWGQLGDTADIENDFTTSRLTPVSVAGAVKTFCHISAGRLHTVALDKSGRAWAWGGNFSGELGVGYTEYYDEDDDFFYGEFEATPVSVAGTVKTFCHISSGTGRTFAIDKSGRAWAWGDNFFGELGDGTNIDRCTPVSVAGVVKTFCYISAGYEHAVAIDKSGRAWAWGNNFSGQLGVGFTNFTPNSVIGAVKTFCHISAGASHTVAIDKSGRAWAWGTNSSGELGDNTTTSRSFGFRGEVLASIGTPVSVAGAVKTFCHISAGDSYTVALDKAGRAWAWGFNNRGQLGDNTTTSRCTPVSVAGTVKTFCHISAGASHTVALDKAGRAWAWGFNNRGQLGDNTTTSRRTPVSVAGAVKTFCHISAGASQTFTHTVALDKAGRAWAWGDNFYGQLGDNTTTSRRTPVSVAGAVKTFCHISAGRLHTVALDKSGRAWTWGANFSGQLGDNTTTSRRTPVSLLGAVKTFCHISAGGSHTVALDKSGRAWAWGQSYPRTPVSVAGAVKTFCHISADGSSVLAIDKSGRAWAWGLNIYGRLGTVRTNTPMLIKGL
jgi:alpha-tubulin suppressor-like RCC1 family protein